MRQGSRLVTVPPQALGILPATTSNTTTTTSTTAVGQQQTLRKILLLLNKIKNFYKMDIYE